MKEYSATTLADKLLLNILYCSMSYDSYKQSHKHWPPTQT